MQPVATIHTDADTDVVQYTYTVYCITLVKEVRWKVGALMSRPKDLGVRSRELRVC